MQPIDPTDKRRLNVQIAASIRAAILNGELTPGSRLPSGQELAKFFGVAPMTVQSAVHALRDEGFLRSLAGSGVFVRDQASLPDPDHDHHPLAGTAAFLFEMGHLKHLARAGWLLLGIPQPESVAEHTFRVAIVGIALAAQEGADIGRTAALCLLHDSPESRIGDVPSVGRAYVSTASPEAVAAHQTSGMPPALAEVFQGLVAEYEAAESIESQVAHDADKVETLLQAVEYQAQGYDTAGWRDSSTAALRTSSAQELAQAISSADPHEWWSAFAASYRELRATSRGSKSS
jgi:5'-deoxynucleotidase YfbR-like HD superfamily hydrolase